MCRSHKMAPTRDSILRGYNDLIGPFLPDKMSATFHSVDDLGNSNDYFDEKKLNYKNNKIGYF